MRADLLRGPTDADILAAVRDGGRTTHIAERLHVYARRRWVARRLKRLERAGLVRRTSHSAINDIYWEVAPNVRTAAQEPSAAA